MPIYEVFIPAKPGSGDESVFVEVEASSWLLALRTGMHQIGDQGDSLASVMCENRSDGTIIVKDPASRRMFRIKELSAKSEVSNEDSEASKKQAETLRLEAEQAALEQEEADKRLQLALEKEQATEQAARDEAKHKKQAEEQAAKAAQKEQQKLEEQTAKEHAAKEQAAIAAQKAEQEAAAKKAALAQIERSKAEKKLLDSKKKAKKAKDKAAKNAEGISREIKVSRTNMNATEISDELAETDAELAEESYDVDEILADLFMETMDIMMMSQQDSPKFILDMALRTIKAEAGSVILSDVNSTLADLYFAAAKGQVAKKLMEIRIPRGKGIVGFSVQAGCTLAISDVNQNKIFYKEISEKIGFKTQSILCVPIQFVDRTFGAIELINKINSDRWNEGDIGIVQFLANKLGEHLNAFHENVSLKDL